MNPANTLSQLSPGMAECHARLMAVAKHGTPEAFSATLAGVLQRAELSISNAYDAGAASAHETMAVPTGTVRAGFSEGEIDAAIHSSRDAFFANNPHLFRTEAFERFFTEAFALGAEYVRAAFSAQPDAQPAERMPSWMQYDKRYDILTIHGKRYSASMFGDDGFIAPAGTLLRVEAGDPDCVTLHKITAAQPVAQDGALGLLKFNDDMGASITGLPAMTINPGDEFLIFPKSKAQPSSEGTADQWSKSEIDAAIKVNAPQCFEAVINLDVEAPVLRAYLQGGAWHAAFLDGAASREKAPAGATQGPTVLVQREELQKLLSGQSNDDMHAMLLAFDPRFLDELGGHGPDLVGLYIQYTTTAQAAPSAPFNAETQDQIAAVMLQHGTEAQQRAALAYASGTAQAAGAVAGTVLFVSHEQLAGLLSKPDPEGEHGRYLPIRRVSAGKFTHPLFAVPTPAAQQGDA